ncbi:hypothetical protein Dsin_022241 [Dipteronia sinensis]|uniref:Uncharacterized protein n=1 Tax=Dipteronia sinensis TaxID=43782 RepID=A0AAE0A2G6_9ROSI|nr:hypothetical protein Dsin_022241 [Dipteronia sinensis]
MNPHVGRFRFSEAMEPNFGDPFESSSSSSSSSSPSGDEEAVNDLLEKCWFFGNLFQRKTRMLRSYSDPCCPPSSKEIFTRNSDSQNITKNEITAGDGDCVVQRNLIRAPSLPPCVGRKMEENHQEKESSTGGKTNKLLTRQSSLPKPASAGKKEATKEKASTATRSKSNNGQFPRSNLHRTPSLPSYFGREEDKESDARMSNLIHQAFSTSSDILPKSHTSKGLTRSYSISRYRPPRSSEVERHYNYNMNGSIKDMSRRRCLINQNKSRKKSTSDLESEEVQGFKDLGFTFEKQELSPSVVNILPGLQEKNNSNNNREELNQEKFRRPYLSEAWLSHNFAPPPPPPIPNWATENSALDMKAQIKFWARAVASNVHEEC